MKKELILGLSLVLFPVVSSGQRLDQPREPVQKGSDGARGQGDPSGAPGSTNSSPRLVSIFTQGTPGNYSVVVPTNAVTATITAVGGGAGGPSGGGAGAIVNFPVSVASGQIINVNVGAGGTKSQSGTDTTIVIGTLVLMCDGGAASPDGVTGGNGGAVNLSFAKVAGGAGGSSEEVGTNGNVNYFAYSGAGGGGAGASGGNVLLFVGGPGNGSSGGGGGASALANGAGSSTKGSLGSGGAGSSAGGNGYVEIVFER
jgi:hypothetical protein